MKKKGGLTCVTISGITAVFLCLPPKATSWSRWQHEVVAEIAWQNLTPAAREAVGEILGQGTGLSNIATWADRMKHYRPETAPWHYVNYPLEMDEPDYDLMSAPSSNILFAIEVQIAVLKDKSASPKSREEALKYLVHFVGDLHQPLHCGTGDDSGGNGVPVRWRHSFTNLHKVWDSYIFQEKETPPATWARILQQGLTPQERSAIMAGRPFDWMVESHAIARDICYERLPREGKYSKRLRLPDLAGSYAEEARPVFKKSLLKGGLRLAMLLNEIFEQPTTTGFDLKFPSPVGDLLVVCLKVTNRNHNPDYS